MTNSFKEWVRQYSDGVLEPGCGRYVDMEAAYRAGREKIREEAARKMLNFFSGLGSKADRIIRDLPLEGDDVP